MNFLRGIYKNIQVRNSKKKAKDEENLKEYKAGTREWIIQKFPFLKDCEMIYIYKDINNNEYFRIRKYSDIFEKYITIVYTFDKKENKDMILFESR